VVEFSDLLKAIASLLWPLFAFTALFLFRPQIIDLTRRLKKGKLLGQELELEESLKLLDESASAIEREVASLPIPPVKTISNQVDKTNEEDTLRNITSEASRSPKAALILLAIEIEKLAQQLLASTGQLQGRKYVPIIQAIGELDEQFGLPRHVPSSLKFFWEARNRFIHGSEGTDEDILRAIDSGLTILKSLQAFPREINVIYHPGVEIFTDEHLGNIVQKGKGVILETTAPGGASKSLRIFPTTRTNYVKGQQVAWEWSFDNVWDKCWYRHPDTGEVMVAWNSAAEFIGRPFEEL